MLKEELIQMIHGQNKYLTKEHLNTLSYEGLLRNVNPIYRSYYAKKLYINGLIDKSIARLFLTTF